MRKKVKKQEKLLPLLIDDDFPFGDESVAKESRSFAEMFDVVACDTEIDEFMQRRQEGRTQTKNIYPPPQENLDLHGLTGDEAERRVENFLLTVRGKGLRTVRIITGKGIHSQGNPVLRNLMDQLARALKAHGKIRNFTWENGQREKSGAVIIYL